jgi:hypothetical protein
MEKVGGDHKTLRTEAIMSLKVGWYLLHQSGGMVRRRVRDVCINPCA